MYLVGDGWQGFLVYLFGRELARVSSVSCWARAGKGF